MKRQPVRSSGRTCSVTAPVHLVVQLLQLLFKVFSIGLPRHAVDKPAHKRTYRLLDQLGAKTSVLVVGYRSGLL
jgi:hypothetical protein